MENNLDITIFTGHFGSGKTEFAINYSINLAKQGKKVILVDLDIVNPFFRSTEAKKLLMDNHVELISPNYAGSNVDVPSLPATIYGVFEKKNTHVIFDVGGDEDGATALGGYYPYFKKNPYRMFNVINTCRPFTNNVESIIELTKKIEDRSRLKITDLIHNTNLSYETTTALITRGHKIVTEVSEKLRYPITYIGVIEELKDELPKDLKMLAYPIKRYMKPLWEK